MARKSKLERLQALCAADPQNPFGWYSLAIEQKKSDAAKAIEVFAKVHAEHPAYLANYYHFAGTLADEGEVERAQAIYEEGVALAKEQGDAHTLSELEAALDLL